MTVRLDDFTNNLGMTLRTANKVGDRCFVNVPSHPATEFRVYDWPHEHSGARYDRRVLIVLYADGGFSCSLECEAHSAVAQRDELERAIRT